jgi:predicted Zn-dependent peptidase
MSVQVSTLANGLRVVSETMERVETVSVGVWVGVGTRNEAPEVNGLAHFLEHMAFKGTGRRSARDIAEEIEAVGGHLNAYTSRENTAYYAKVLKEDAALAVDVLADILQNSTFEEDELARERDVVLQEIGQSNDTPDDIIFDHFQTTAYPSQPIGRPVLGSAEIVRSLSRPMLFDYVAEKYQAPSMVLSAAGRIEHAALVELAEANFAGLPAGDSASPVPASYQGGDYRESKELEQVHLLLGFPGLPYGDDDYYALGVYSTLLGGGMSSRLFQEVREKRGLVYSIYSFSSSYRDGGLFGIYAGTGETKVAELVPVVCGEVRAVAEAVSDEEVRRARAQMKAGLLMSLESTGSRAEQLAQQLLIFGRPIPADEVIAKIDAVDAEAVQRVGARVAAGSVTCAALGPIGSLETYDKVAARLA